MTQINFTPPPTLAAFMRSDNPVRAVTGPVGSGKTTAMLMELFRRAAEVPHWPNTHVRKSKAIIVRNTLPQLKSTCLESVMHFLGPVARFRPSSNTIEIRAGDIHADWLLLPLDTPQNVQRLLSLEATTAWVSEFREIDPQIVFDTYSRTGRFPPQGVVPSFRTLIMESNSFSEDSPWNDVLVNRVWKGKDLSDMDMQIAWFRQPSALSPEAENLENLHPDYYRDMIALNTEEWVAQYIENRITPSLAGTAVFKESFVSKFHVCEGLKPRRGSPLIVGMDFARWPAAVIGQMTEDGRLLLFQELERQDCGVEKFVRENLVPMLMNDERFRGLSCYIVGDPSGTSRGEVGEESVFDMLKRYGLSAYPAMTNNIAPRLRAVEKWLLQQRSGEPAIQFEKYGVSKLILAMQSKYRYKKNKDGNEQDKPDKSVRPFADLADALQYLCLGTSKQIRSVVMRPSRPPESPVPAAAWT